MPSFMDYTGRHSIRITAGDRAAYLPQMDMITCPDISQFRTSEHYYATMFHECIHSTGPRLDRFKGRSGLLWFRYLRARGTGCGDRECLPGSAYRHRFISHCPESGSISPELGSSNQGRCRSGDVCSRQGREGSGLHDRGFCPGPCQRNRNRYSGRGDSMTTIFDAMPIKVLEELERIETRIPVIRTPGFSCCRLMRRIFA